MIPAVGIFCFGCQPGQFVEKSLANGNGSVISEQSEKVLEFGGGYKLLVPLDTNKSILHHKKGPII